MMTKISIELTSQISQEHDTETIKKQMPGELVKEKDTIRVQYLEDEEIPVKMLLKDKKLIIRRGTDSQNYSLMKFALGEKMACRYVVAGRQMDLISVTNKLYYHENSNYRKVQVEYDLFTGLYLVGNYTVTLIFT